MFHLTMVSELISKYNDFSRFFINLRPIMTVQIFILIAGLLLILLGANYLVDGASSIAKRFGLSEFIIGVTIVGIGTSAPEMVVSFMSAFQGKADMFYNFSISVAGLLHPLYKNPSNMVLFQVYTSNAHSFA